MNLRDPELMSSVIGRVLRYGVILSAATVLFGTILLASSSGVSDSADFLVYLSNQVPHLAGFVSLQGLLSGVVGLQAYSWIELGVIFLIATPVSRVAISVLLFAAERDRLYVIITAVVLALLLFSLLATPSIPLFQS